MEDNSDTIRNTIRQYILDHFLPGEDPNSLTDQIELRESGILDSHAILNLVLFLEQTFGVEIETANIEAGGLSNIESIEQLVQAKIK